MLKLSSQGTANIFKDNLKGENENFEEFDYVALDKM